MELKCYSIGDLSKIVNVSANTLRFWEKQKYIPIPSRMMSGKRWFRRYSEGDLELIKMFKNYVDQGLTLKSAAAKITTTMEDF